MRKVTEVFLQVFATWLGWVWIALLLSVYFGWKSYHTIDEESQRWLEYFCIAIAYPVLMVIVQILYPWFIKIKFSALVIFPCTILIAWVVNGPFDYPAPQWIWYAGIPILLISAALIWWQPSSDDAIDKLVKWFKKYIRA